MLATIAGAVDRPGIYETPRGMPLRDLLGWARPSEPLSALLVGGYFGGWLRAAAAEPLALLDADLRAAGTSLGARAIVALPETACGVLETARIARYPASESAGRCGPCVHGLGAIAGAIEGLALRQPGDADQLPRWLAQSSAAARAPIRTGPYASSRVRSTSFAEELELHARRPLQRQRPAGAAASALGGAARMSKRLRVNPIACDAHRLCAELLPERIRLDDWGYPIVDDAPIQRALEGHAKRGVAAGPVCALALVPDDMR